MPLINWEARFSVGVRQLDNQHRQLVKLLNELHDAMAVGRGNQIIEPILDGLIEYTQTHFATEEQLFQLHGYPRSAGHKLEHDALVRKVSTWKQRFQSGQRMISIEISKELRDWLVNHILESDQLYGPYLNERGVC